MIRIKVILKRILFVCLFMLVGLLGAMSISGYVLVLPISEIDYKVSTKISVLEVPEGGKGRIIGLLKNFDFDKGDWAVYVKLDIHDLPDMGSGIEKVTCLKTSDKSLLDEMKKAWKFRVTGGDMATVTSAIYFLQDGKLLYKSPIVIDERVDGLQSYEFGWLEPTEPGVLRRHIKKFQRCYSPVVIF